MSNNVDKLLFPVVEEVPEEQPRGWHPTGYQPGPDDPGPVEEDHLDQQGAGDHA